MNNNLLIIGAGMYGVVAKEIAQSMKCFDTISFIDDRSRVASDGVEVIGTTSELATLIDSYHNIAVAIGTPEARLGLLQRLEKDFPGSIVTLISPMAYVAPSAQIGKGCIIEPMAVVHTACTLGIGCLISAGAVVNHASVCCDGVHVDCNATVPGYMTIPAKTKVACGTVYKNVTHTPTPTDGLEYTFESGV